MAPEHYISLFSSLISFAGLLLVVLQLRQSTKQRETESLVEITGTSRQLVGMAFYHPKLFAILQDSKDADPVWEQYYLQLWLNQFALTHAYIKQAVLKGELRENLRRDVADFMSMTNMQRHWERFGRLYPESFQQYVNEILKKVEPPKAAHVHSGR